MGNTMTAEESRDECVKIMGEPLGKQYAALWQELAWINAKWSEYVELFGSKESRIDLLNKAAPVFFRVVQDTLWEDLLLHIARLTEPPRAKGKAVLTVQTLPDLVDASIRDSVASKVAAAESKAVFCRDWRHRHIAHRNLALALKVEKKPLEPASRQGVQEALSAIADVLNEVSRHYQKSETVFDHELPGGGTAVNLLYVIDDGLKVAAERLDRLSRGEPRPEDWINRDL